PRSVVGRAVLRKHTGERGAKAATVNFLLHRQPNFVLGVRTVARGPGEEPHAPGSFAVPPPIPSEGVGVTRFPASTIPLNRERSRGRTAAVVRQTEPGATEGRVPGREHSMASKGLVFDSPNTAISGHTFGGGTRE